MKLYIDGDALPNKLKGIILRAIERHSLETIVVANKLINVGKSSFIRYIVVDAGEDEADNHIVELVSEGDLVITADIPLADRLVSKNAIVIDHRGGLFDEENIKQYLAMRNLMQDIRDSGGPTKGPAPFMQKEAHAFASQLNNVLVKYK